MTMDFSTGKTVGSEVLNYSQQFWLLNEHHRLDAIQQVHVNGKLA